jgi:hypothetical protein
VILGKKGVTASEVYVGGAVDQSLSGWLAQQFSDVSLGA